jgi:hypothetical protein
LCPIHLPTAHLPKGKAGLEKGMKLAT